MSDGFEPYPTIPDFASALTQRIANKTGATPGPLPPPGTVDPYKLMLQRRQGDTAPIDTATIQKWPEEDVKALEDYCKRMGVVGFASRLNPKIALMQLKQQFGDYSGVPLDERIPAGYERIGDGNKYSPSYPYSEAIAKKQILHG